MAQRVFTFHSPVDTTETVKVITKVVSVLSGKTKVEGNVITAIWWREGATLFPHKFKFFVGKNLVRVVTGDFSSAYYKRIKWEFNNNPVLKVWSEFVRVLTQTFPNLNFELEPGKFHIVSAKIMSDGMEQTFTAKSVKTPSITGALLGGAIFGGVGAIIGGSGGKTRTSGSTNTVFSGNVLVRARYSNGFILEGTVSTKSTLYNRILVNLNEE